MGIGMTSQRTRERLIQRLMDQGITRVEVLEAIRSVPRHLFVDEALAHRSYEDTALPIGYGQTLSQPYMVARMSELALARGKPRKVLEIGSGSGYQTAFWHRWSTKSVRLSGSSRCKSEHESNCVPYECAMSGCGMAMAWRAGQVRHHLT